MWIKRNAPPRIPSTCKNQRYKRICGGGGIGRLIGFRWCHLSEGFCKWKDESGKWKVMDSILEQKSFQFAIRTVNLCKHLRSTKKEYTLSKQLLRSGTSIGANIAEAQQAQSKGGFHFQAEHRSERNHGNEILDQTHVCNRILVRARISLYFLRLCRTWKNVGCKRKDFKRELTIHFTLSTFN